MKKRMPRGGYVPDSDQVDEEPMAEIYITRNAWKRLNGEGSWFQESRYSTTPSACFPVKTRAPKCALMNGSFHPDHCEDVDAVAECCEEVVPADEPEPESE
ncbi:MAG: hypothetical protein Q7R85_00850 [bacterium]|nr:hypothetical protein [bacterium]